MLYTRITTTKILPGILKQQTKKPYATYSIQYQSKVWHTETMYPNVWLVLYIHTVYNVYFKMKNKTTDKAKYIANSTVV